MKRSITERLVYWLAARRPMRKIDGPGGEPYLKRYYIGSLFGRHVYLHHFLASDPGRGLHDHPWRWAVSLILIGGYYEERLLSSLHGPVITTKTREPGSINVLRGDDFHTILLPKGSDAWTLFVTGPRCKGWGFVEFDEDGTYIYDPHTLTREYPEDRWWKRAARVGS